MAISNANSITIFSLTQKLQNSEFIFTGKYSFRNGQINIYTLLDINMKKNLLFFLKN